MNRSSSQLSNQSEDQEGVSAGIRSDAGISSQNKEENKAHQPRADQVQPQGLHLSLSTAQAYSIMKNIPPEYRLLEKTYLKKNTTRKRTRAEAPFRNSKKLNITAKPRSRRQREAKNAKEYISSEYIDQIDYMGPPENLDDNTSIPQRTNGAAKPVQPRCERGRYSADSQKNNDARTPSETQDEGKYSSNKSAISNGYDKLAPTDTKTIQEEVPVSQMKIKLDPIEEEGSPVIPERELLDSNKPVKSSEPSNHPQMMNNISNPISTASSKPMKDSSERKPLRLQAEEEPLSGGDEHFSTQAILSSYSKKSEKLLSTLNEVVAANS